MTPFEWDITLPKWIKPTIAGVILITVGLYGRSCYLEHKAKESASQAAQHDQAGTNHAAQGAAYDSQAAAQNPTLQANNAEIQRLRMEVARLRKKPPVPDPAPVPWNPAPNPVPPPVDLAPLVSKLDELNQALTKENADLKANILTLTAARDSWRSAAGEFQREAVSLRIAHEAQLSAIKAARWKGRIEGFAVGLGSGYIGGRLK